MIKVFCDGCSLQLMTANTMTITEYTERYSRRTVKEFCSGCTAYLERQLSEAYIRLKSDPEKYKKDDDF